MINSHIVCPTPTHRPQSLMDNSYSALKKRIRGTLQAGWASLFLTPGYYLHPPTLSQRPFIGLGKFVAGRIQQMRAGSSYLAAHPTWRSPNADTPAPVAPCKDKPSSMLSYRARGDRTAGRASSTALLTSVPKPHSRHPSLC